MSGMVCELRAATGRSTGAGPATAVAAGDFSINKGRPCWKPSHSGGERPLATTWTLGVAVGNTTCNMNEVGRVSGQPCVSAAGKSFDRRCYCNHSEHGDITCARSPAPTAANRVPEDVATMEDGAAIRLRKESCMKSKRNIWVASLAAFLLGMPLAERVVADDTEEIVFASIGLIWEIIDAAVSAS